MVARIDANYQRRLSLQEVAAAEFVSEAAVTLISQRGRGKFCPALTALRLRHAADQLLTTRKTVQQIAREQGFASTRMMSDLFKRQHGVTPRQYREQHPLELARPRRRRPIAGSRWRPTGCMRDSMSRNHATGKVPLPINPPQTREINLRDRPARPAALRHTRMVVTVRELDDLLRADVRRELEQLHHALPVYAIDINDPFQQSAVRHRLGRSADGRLRLLVQPAADFSWLAEMGWQVILHTGVTTRSDLLQRFLQLAANHFPPATLNSWRFVWHWSPQAAKLRAPGGSSARVLHRCCRAAAGDLAPLCSQRSGNDSLFHSPLLAEADFLACRADANEQLDLAQQTAAAASSEHYPLHKLRQIPAPCASVSSTCRCGCSPEYADRRYAGYHGRFSRRAADG